MTTFYSFNTHKPEKVPQKMAISILAHKQIQEKREIMD